MKNKLISLIIIILTFCVSLTITSCEKNDFKDAYAIVYIDKIPYLYNKEGQMKSLEKYESITNEFGDLLVVSRYINKKLRYGYIDRNGKEVISLKYEMAYPFSEGKAVVKENGIYEIIDTNNKVLYKLPKEYASYSKFSEGFLKIETPNGFSFINSNYEKCPIDFYQVREYSESKALVTIKENDNYSFAYLDTNYNLTLADKLTDIESADSFYDGLALVKNKHTKMYSYIKKDGTYLIDENGNFEFEAARAFKEGKAVVFTGKPYYQFDAQTGIRIADYYSYQYLNSDGTYYDYNYRAFHHEDKNNVLLWGYLGNWCGDIVLTRLFTTGAGKWQLYKDSVIEKQIDAIPIYYYDAATTFDDEIIPTGLNGLNHGIEEINVTKIEGVNIVQLVLQNSRKTTLRIDGDLTIKALHYELAENPEFFNLYLTYSDNSVSEAIKICNHSLKEIPFTSDFDDLSKLDELYYTMPYDITKLSKTKYYTNNEEIVIIAVRVSTDKVALVDANGKYLTKALFDDVIF